MRAVMSSGEEPVASAGAMASASSRRSCRVRRQAERVGLSWTVREKPGPAKPMPGSWVATPASKARRSAQRADSPAGRARTASARPATNAS